MDDIQQLLRDLSWNKPNDIVETAISKLLQIDDQEVILLLQPCDDKSCWDNAALVLKKIGYPRNKLAIPGLFEWIQDMNWPGAQTAKETLHNINKEDLIPFLEEALVKAAADSDFIWIASIKELLQNMPILEDDFTKQSIYELLNLAV